ncbi:hypothetical protein [Caulobacter sp. DWR2-3-1b2]|uniref:hypothetical protein n=1 Tax=unclassified Caulobacter TaxID=2648921 RepID=UPI003CEF1C86
MINADRFELDLRPFADPATVVEVIAGDALLRARLFREGEELNVTIDVQTGKVNTRSESGSERSFVNFRSLLASDLFAAVKTMADNQKRILSQSLPALFIEPEGIVDGAPLSQSVFENSTSLPTHINDEKPIRLILIDGPAGVGKTSTISRLVSRRAINYGKEAFEPPILHVANRGRRLVSFDELVALSIQLVRAKFTYDQVPSLIRNGVIQIAIDGFDELVDADGYADAWSVLKDFLNEVGSGGPILLAGRDTFFDLAGFREKLGDISSYTAISHVRLSSITPKSAKEWLVRSGWGEDDLKTDQAQDLLKENSYALRPYFLSEIAKVGKLETLLQELVNPREYLVRKFIEREAGLIVQRVPLEKEKAIGLLLELFELIAIEMAEAETEAVDVPFLQLAVEVTFGKEIKDPTDLAKLRHKAGSFALMDNDARQDFRKFPHTEISNHFLASALLKRLRDGDTPRFLRRGYLGSDFMSVVGDTFFSMDIKTVTEVRRRLINLTRSDVGFERLTENASSLSLSTLVVNSLPEPLQLVGLPAGEVVIFGTAGNADLTNVTIARMDARGADLSAVKFDNCRVSIMVVDGSTAFGSQPPAVDCLMVEDLGSQEMHYNPAAISSWIEAHRPTPVPEDGNREAVELLERVARVFMRQFYIKDEASEFEGRYLSMPFWPEIEAILIDADRLRRNDRKDAAGRPCDFVHIVDAGALLAAATNEDQRIWRQVASI